MAAIQLTHARRAFDGSTDWAAILALYDALVMVRPGPMVWLNRAMAMAHVEGSNAALSAIEELPSERLVSSRPLHVARAELFFQVGDNEESAKALDAALALSLPRAERLFLERKRIELSQA